MAISYTFTTFAQFSEATNIDITTPEKFYIVGYDAKEFRELRFDFGTYINPTIKKIESAYTSMITLTSTLEATCNTIIDNLQTEYGDIKGKLTDDYETTKDNLQTEFERLSSETVSKDLTYTNKQPTPINFTVDGVVRIPKGTTFDNVLIADIITRLLYPTIQATINVTYGSSLIEIGVSNSKTVNIGITEGTVIKVDENRTYTFTGIDWESPTITNKATTATNIITITPTTETSYNYKVTVSQNNSEIISQTFKLTSVYPLYVATGTSTNITTTKQNLIAKNNIAIVTFTKETANTYYTLDVPGTWNDISKMEVLDTSSNTYKEWNNWKTEFNKSEIKYGDVTYKRYCRTGKPVGEEIGNNKFRITF